MSNPQTRTGPAIPMPEPAKPPDPPKERPKDERYG